MNIKVLGGGCKSCEALLRSAKEAVANKGIDAEVFKAARTQKIKYRFRCADCGAEINRTRESNFTKHYTMYRCGKCHGKIVKVA